MQKKEQKRLIAIEKELRAAAAKEEKYVKAMQEKQHAAWKIALEEKIPAKVREGVEGAFAKAFSMIFQKGKTVIEKSYRKETLIEDHDILDYAFRVKCGRRELRAIEKNAGRSHFRNVAFTTAEGVGLGALGVGLPDVVIFLGVILRGVFETALCYGYSYESRAEQMLILQMMEASLSAGEAFDDLHVKVNERMAEPCEVSDEMWDEQIRKTAAAFSSDTLLLKFVQGLPVVGVIGGAANPVYYNKVMRYVQLCYHKRYLQKIYWERTAE